MFGFSHLGNFNMVPVMHPGELQENLSNKTGSTENLAKAGLELWILVLDITTITPIGSQVEFHVHPCKRGLKSDEDGSSAGPEDREGLYNNAMHHKARQSVIIVWWEQYV